MTEAQTLLAEIEAFMKRSDIRPGPFGLQATGNHKLVPRLREGGSVTLDTAARIRSFIASDGRRPAAPIPADLEHDGARV